MDHGGLTDEFKDVMADWYGLYLYDNQVEEYLDTLGKNDLEEMRESGIDTVDRELFADWLAKKIAGVNCWPLKITEEFHDKFLIGARKQGYDLNLNIWYYGDEKPAMQKKWKKGG